MKIKVVAEIEIPDKNEGYEWIETNGDGGYFHIKEELARALFLNAQCAHLERAVEWLARKPDKIWSKESIEEVAKDEKMWAKAIGDAKLEFSKAE